MPYLNVPLPDILPVSGSTDIAASLLDRGRSLRSANINGLKVAFSSTGVAGNVNRYRAVWLVTVISALMSDTIFKEKYPGDASTVLL
jgi:hypothetical protein